MKNQLLLIGFILALLSCKKDPPPKPVTPAKYDNGILALNEGLFEQNNASMTFYNYQDAFQLVFKSENNRGLGDTANDFDTYSIAGKDYIIIAVDVSSQVEIIERNTLKSVAQIQLLNGTNAREPRRVIVYDTKAFVCNFDGTVAVIDLTTNSLITLIEVGKNPDGLAIVNDKLYVSNSGGLNYPVYDSTISVINMASHTVETTFTTRINSAEMIVDSQNEIYLVSRGNYDDVPPALLRIDTETNTVLSTLEIPASYLNLVGDWLYYYNSTDKAIFRYNTITEVLDPIAIIDVSSFETFYGFHFDPIKGHLFCVDANGYVNSSTIRAYDLSGSFLYEFQGGLNTNDLIFNN